MSKKHEEILDDVKDALDDVKDVLEDAAETVVAKAKPVAKKVKPAAKRAAKAGAEAAQAVVESAKKATPKKPECYLQFNGKEINMDSLIATAKAEFKEENKRSAIITCRVYVKPEEGAAYYVINDDYFGRIAL